MGVYIKGMEMPTDNTVLLRIYPENDGVFYAEQLDIDGDILNKYWAVHVPPHGRLIDADALLKDIAPTDEDEDNGAKLLMNVFCQVVKTRPTIIPADRKDGDPC